MPKQNHNTSSLPDKYEPGDPIVASVMTSLVRFVKTFTVSGAATFYFDGRKAHLHVRSGGGPKPFDILDSGTDTDVGQVRLVPGTATSTPSSGASSVVPEYDGTALNADPFPELEYDDDGSEDGIHEVYLGCEINGSNQVISGTWEIHHRKPGDAAIEDVAYNSTGPVNGEAYLLLGTFEVDSGALVSGSINNMIRSSVVLVVCNAEERRWVWSGFGVAN